MNLLSTQKVLNYQATCGSYMLLHAPSCLHCGLNCDLLMLLQIKDVLSSGTGDFDQERLLHQLPKELSLSEKKVHRAVEDQAKDRKRTTLVQAVSYLRQKKMDDTVKALNNLVACNKV